MDPPVTHFQAFFTTPGGRLDHSDLVKMTTGFLLEPPGTGERRPRAGSLRRVRVLYCAAVKGDAGKAQPDRRDPKQMHAVH